MVLKAQLPLLIILILIPIPAAWGQPDEAAGRVVSVVSGDSMGIEMLITDPRANNIDSIKLADIEAPSTVTPEGKAAKAYVASLLKNKTVYLDIEDNINQCRSQWGQLICLVYLMDENGQPIWPPVNRIIVDEGHATLHDDPENEFNSSDWWKLPSRPLTGEKSDQMRALLEKESSSPLDPEESNAVSILEKRGASGGYVIGYHNK